MKPRFPSASRLGLAAHCVYPWSSGATWLGEGAPTPDQRYGNAFHVLAERALGGTTLLEGEALDALARACAAEHALTEAESDNLRAAALRLLEAIQQDHVQGPLHVETAAAFDPLTGTRRLMVGNERGEPHELYGRADLVFLRTDGVLVVRDWKTGERAREAAPRDTPQLRALALLFSEPGVPVRVELAFLGEDGIEIRGDDLTAEDLRDVEGELVELAAHLEAPPEPRPGPWCERLHCPMRATCPATLAALASVDAEITRYPLTGPVQGPEHAAFLRHRLAALQAWMEERERAVREEAKRAPLPVAGKDGTYWGPVEYPGHEKIAATPEVMEVLRTELPAGVEKAVSMEVTKASLDRAVRAQVLQVHGGNRLPRGVAGKLKERVFGRLRELGALKRGAPYVRFTEFKKMGDAVVPNEEETGDERA